MLHGLCTELSGKGVVLKNKFVYVVSMTSLLFMVER